MLLAAWAASREQSHQSYQYRGAIPEAPSHFLFSQWGQEELYLGSADLMPRNLDRKVELAFRVEDHTLLRFLRDEFLPSILRTWSKPDMLAVFNPKAS